MRLQNKLLFLAAGPCAAVIAAIMLFAWNRCESLLDQQISRYAASELARISAQFDAFFTLKRSELAMLAETPVVRSGNLEEILPYFAREEERLASGIEGLYYNDVHGTAYGVDGSTFNVRDRYYFPTIDGGEPVVTKIIESRATARPIVLVLVPVFAEDGTRTGAVGGSILVEDLLRAVTQVRISENGFAIIIDEDGRLVSGFGEQQPKDRSSQPLSPQAPADSSALAALVADIRSGEKALNTPTSLNFRDRPYIASFEPLSSVRWTLAVLYQEPELLGALREARGLVLLIAVCGLLAAAIFAMGIKRVALDPINALVAVQRRLGTGDHDARLEHPPADELGELARSFNDMAHRLSVRTAALESEICTRKVAEDAARESEQRYRAIAEDTPVLICRFLPDGKITYANEAYRKYFNLTEEQIATQSIYELMPAEERQAVREEILGLSADVATRSHEHRVLTPNGEIAWQRWTNRALFDHAGQTKAYQAIGEDITAWREAEEARASLERQVQHSQKLESLGVLAGGIAHDFNNLLMAILGNADLAMETLDARQDARPYVLEIINASKRAADLARQMLAYSGRGHFVVEPIDLPAMIHEMASLLEVSISKKTRIDFAFADGTPQFHGDATQIRQVIMNLITNASEAMGERGGTITLSTGPMACTSEYLNAPSDANSVVPGAALQAGTYIYLEVADDGCGMDRGTLERIFDPFFTTKFTGRGLGMSAVLGIVRGHGGTMKVRSAPGEGTTFRILFPASQAVAATAIPPAIDSANPSQWQGTGTVLVVDDEDAVCQLVSRLLDGMGLTALTAPDGEIGLACFQEHADEISCVLLDLTMPNLDGKQVYERIRARRPELPVILCSGFSAQDAVARFGADPAADFIHKPFRLKALREKLIQVLERSAPPV